MVEYYVEVQPCEVTIKVSAVRICLLLELQVGHDSGIGKRPPSLFEKGQKE